MRTVIRDTFTGPNGTALESHAPDVGGLWAKVFGALSATIQSNTLQRVSHVTPSFYINTASPQRDFEMSFVLVAFSGTNGFLAHRQSNSDLYYAIYNSGLGRYEINLLAGGVVTLLVSFVEAAPALPATFMLRVRKGDEYLRLLVNGIEKVATNDQTLLGGLAGLYTQGFGSTTTLDDFLLEAVEPVDVLAALATAIRATSGFSDDQVSVADWRIAAYGHPQVAIIDYEDFAADRMSSDQETLFSWTARIHLLVRYTDDAGANNALRTRREEIVSYILNNPTLAGLVLDSMPVRGGVADPEEVEIGGIVFLKEWIDIRIEEVRAA